MGTTLPISDGVYSKNSNLTIDTATIPSNFSTSHFKTIIFVNGDLTINKNLILTSDSTLLFVVSGDIKIDKAVTEIDSALISDKNIYTAYNATAGDVTTTLMLKGVFIADKFVFQRTLQGTDNTKTSSEEFTYEPKYVNAMKTYLGTNAVKWVQTD